MDERALRQLWAGTVPSPDAEAALASERTYKPDLPEGPPVALSHALPVATLRYAQAAEAARAKGGASGGGAAAAAGGLPPPGSFGDLGTVPTLSGGETSAVRPAAASDAAAAPPDRPQSTLSGRTTIGAATEADARAPTAPAAAAAAAPAPGPAPGPALAGPGPARSSGPTVELPAVDEAGSRSAHPTIDLPSYELIREIGRGGMGVVYRARQGSLDREVAIKRIASGRRSPELRESFLAEALVTGVLDHPNIVPVYDLGADPDGEVFLAMKLVGGLSWKHLLHPSTDDERARAREYDLVGHLGLLLNVCNAVGFAHSKGIVHRDLKPENVMVGDFGEVLVMDWGIACDYREEHPEKTRAPHKSTIHRPAGSPAYMAPELAEGRGHDIGPWTDIYLLGAILHEVLTGDPPHKAPTVMAALLSSAESLPPEFDGSVPDELAEICRKALAREASARYQNAPELKQALQGFLRHRESAIITDNALRLLARCEEAATSMAVSRSDLYADFAEAVAALRQAQALWEGNERARGAERRARVAYAATSLEGGDLGLAAAQAARLPEGDWERRQLEDRIAERRAERERQRRAALRLRRTLYATIAVIVLVLALGFVLVRRERDVAVVARKDAVEERGRAEEARNDADERRREAELARNDALEQRNAAERARNEAIEQKLAAERARHAEAEQRARAERAREAEAEQRQLAELRARAARRAEWAAKLEHARVYYDRAFVHLRQGELQSASACALRAVELAPRGLVPEGVSPTFAEPQWAREAWLLYRALSASAPRVVAARRIEGAFGRAGAQPAVAMDASGARVAIAGRPGEVLLVDLGALAGGRTIGGFAGPAGALALSSAGGPGGPGGAGGPGGQVAVGTVEGEVVVLDAATGAEAARFGKRGEASLLALAFAPDGRHLVASAADMTVRVLDLGGGAAGGAGGAAGAGGGAGPREVARLLDVASTATAGAGRAPVGAIAFSGDGAKVLLGDAAGGLYVYATAGWRLEGPIDGREAPGLASGVTRVAVSGTGARAAAGAADGTLAVIDLVARRVTRAIDAEAAVRSLVVDDAGERALVGAGAGARVVDLGAGRTVAVLEGHTGPVALCALADGGRAAVTIEEGGAARRFALPARAPLVQLGGRAQVLGAACVVVGGSAGAPAGPGEPAPAPPSGGIRAVLAPRVGDPAVVEGGGGPGRLLSGHGDTVLAVALAADGQVALTGGYDKTVRRFRLAAAAGGGGTGGSGAGAPVEPTPIGAHEGAVLGIALAPDGQRAATAGADGWVRIHDLATGVEVGRLGGEGVEAWQSVAVSPDGLRVAAGTQRGGTISVWPLGGGAPLARASGHEGGVPALAFAPAAAAGGLLLSGSEDGSARVWSEDGREQRRLEGHAKAVRAVAWSPDGLTVLTGSADGTARLWDATTGRELRRLNGQEREVLAVGFADGGRTAVTIDGRGALGRYPLADAEVAEAPPEIDLGRADPLEAFRPLYQRIGVEVVRDGPVRGTIAPLPLRSE